jgi:hypothetical protein
MCVAAMRETGIDPYCPCSMIVCLVLPIRIGDP